MPKLTSWCWWWHSRWVGLSSGAEAVLEGAGVSQCLNRVRDDSSSGDWMGAIARVLSGPGMEPARVLVPALEYLLWLALLSLWLWSSEELGFQLALALSFCGQLGSCVGTSARSGAGASGSASIGSRSSSHGRRRRARPSRSEPGIGRHIWSTHCMTGAGPAIMEMTA